MAASTDFDNWPKYVSDGGMSWGRFIAMAALTLFTALLLGFIVELTFFFGFYFIGLNILFPALGLMGLTGASVAVGRCRKPWLGAGLGLIAGLVLYLGYFQFDLAMQTGRPDLVFRIDALPRYINWRMMNDVTQSTHGGSSTPRANGPVDVAFHWFFFVLELGIATVLPVLAGRGRSQRAYCPHCDAWKRQATATFPPGAETVARDALLRGDLSEFTRFQRYVPGQNDPHAVLAVEFCAMDGELDTGCPIYFAARRAGSGGAKMGLGKFDSGVRGVTVPRVEISREAATAIAPLFPELAPLTQAVTPGTSLVVASDPARPSSPLGDADPPNAAAIIALPPEQAGQILTTKRKIMLNLLVLLNLAVMALMFFGAIGIMVLEEKYASQISKPIQVTGHVFAVILGLLGIWRAVMLTLDAGAASNRYLRQSAAKIIASRPDSIVSPTDADAVFIEVVSMEKRLKPSLEDAEDVGFLHFDAATRAVAYEGDRERWYIVPEDMMACQPRIVTVNMGNHSSTYVLTELQLRTTAGPRTVYLAPRGRGAGVLNKRSRKGREEALCELMTAWFKQAPTKA